MSGRSPEEFINLIRNDDIDVGMRRKDYEVFVKYGQQHLPDYYFIQTRETDPAVLINYAKIRDSRTTFIELSQKSFPINHGIFIDVFPLDFCPEDETKQLEIRERLRPLNLRIRQEYTLPKENRGSVFKELGRSLAGKALKLKYGDIKRVLEEKERIMTSCLDSRLLVNYSGAYGVKEIIQDEWLGQGLEARFQNETDIGQIRIFSRDEKKQDDMRHELQAKHPITITNPAMTRFLMNLDEAVELVKFAFEHASPGDLFIQKADASTIGDLAKAVQQLFGDTGTNIIGTRHGEKLFETLMTREERLRSEDMGRYFRVAADNRDLNYDKDFVQGKVETQAEESYTSHNTVRLDVEGVVKKILTTDYVQEELKGIRHN